jgi:predicted metal-dependent peptidase
MVKPKKEKDISARDKIIRARTNLLVSNGFFGFLAMQLQLVEVDEDSGITTMAVDGKHMFFYAPFVHKMSERETEGVVAHEVMHCCFKHFTRRGYRDMRGWNIAGDFVINLDLIESGFVLPGKPFGLNSPPLPKGESGYLYDLQFKGMSTEDVYEKLPVIKIGFGSGNGNDPGGVGGVLDAPGDAGDQEATGQDWDVAVRSALQTAKAQNAGSIPGSLRRLIADLEKPKISWRDKTRNFIDQSMTKDVSWSRINRRSMSAGMLMPGYIADRLNHLVFIVDDSGSINMKLLTEFLSEVAGALDEGTADQMTVVYADTRVHHVDHFLPGDIVAPHELPNGGGGTDFADSFRWVKENVPDSSCIIYLTDLQVHSFGEEPECPVLWAVYSPDSYYEQLAANVPWGVPLQVSNSIG